MITLLSMYSMNFMYCEGLTPRSEALIVACEFFLIRENFKYFRRGIKSNFKILFNRKITEIDSYWFSFSRIALLNETIM